VRPVARELLVVDSGSTDRTLEIARSLADRVIEQPWLGFGPQKQFAVEQASADWVLSLDADEALSPELTREIEALDLARDGYELPRRSWYLGRWITHGTWGPDPVLRLETIDLTKQWIEHARTVGCPRVMLNQGTLAPDVLETAIATLKTIGDYGKSRNVFVTLENRGHTLPAQTAGWEVIVRVIKAAGIHANPDTGNFPDEETRAAGLRAMYPLSSGSSHAHYAPERYSEANAIKISKEVGYKGLYSIEAVRSNGPDPYTAVQTIIDELLKDI